MTIEELRTHAKEQGLSEKRIDQIIAELHPDQNGNLCLQESMLAISAVGYTAISIDDVRTWVKKRKDAIRIENYTRVPTDKQMDGDSFKAQKEAAMEYATESGMEPIVIDYRAGYDFIMNLQNELTAKHHDAEMGRLDYKAVKALAATYELQDYLANRIAIAVNTGELEFDPED